MRIRNDRRWEDLARELRQAQSCLQSRLDPAAHLLRHFHENANLVQVDDAEQCRIGALLSPATVINRCADVDVAFGDDAIEGRGDALGGLVYTQPFDLALLNV